MIYFLKLRLMRQTSAKVNDQALPGRLKPPQLGRGVNWGIYIQTISRGARQILGQVALPSSEVMRPPRRPRPHRGNYRERIYWSYHVP